MGKGDISGVLTEEGTLKNMEEGEKTAKNKKGAASKKQTQARAPACTPSTPRLPPLTPRRCQVFSQLEDMPTRALRSASRSVPRLNYYLPLLLSWR